MPRPKQESAAGGSKRKILVRGADGGLYLLTDKELAPYKLGEDEADALTNILKKAEENPKVEKLPASVIKEIKIIATGVIISPETYINNVPKK